LEQTRIETRLIIKHKTNSNFFLQKTEAGWSLPNINGGAERENMVGPIQQAVWEQLQLNVWIGRKLLEKKVEAQNTKVEFYEAELHREQNIKSGFKWGDKEDIVDSIIDEDEIKAIGINLIDESEILEKRAPWFRKGWYDNAERWIISVVNRNQYFIKGSIEQVKVSDLSIILRVPIVNGVLYFKGTGPASRYESKLSQHLDTIHQGKTVNILDINEKEGWLLMWELGGGSLRQIRDKHVWKTAINEYANLQVTEIYYIDTLISLGLPDRRLHILKNDIEKHLTGMCATGLDEETTVKVMALKPELLKMCDEMEGIVPYSIDHGDLHSANIHLVGDEIVFFDWGDATITHPFFSTRVFWHSLDDLVASESEWLDMVNEFRPHYIEPWTRFAPIHELERLLLLSDQLSCVYRALSWYLYITPSRENVDDSFRKPSQWLQVLLEHRELIGVK
jgi:hypothetical protein